METDRPILIYDETCPLCRRSVKWVEDRTEPGAIEVLPCQDSARAERFPQVSERQCMEAVQLVLPDGTVLSGEKALPHLLRMTRGWKWFAFVFSLPLVKHAAPYAYAWVARHRHVLSSLVARKEREECDDDVCETD